MTFTDHGNCFWITRGIAFCAPNGPQLKRKGKRNAKWTLRGKVRALSAISFFFPPRDLLVRKRFVQWNVRRHRTQQVELGSFSKKLVEFIKPAPATCPRAYVTHPLEITFRSSRTSRQVRPGNSHVVSLHLPINSTDSWLKAASLFLDEFRNQAERRILPLDTGRVTRGSSGKSVRGLRNRSTVYGWSFRRTHSSSTFAVMLVTRRYLECTLRRYNRRLRVQWGGWRITLRNAQRRGSFSMRLNPF